MKKEAESMSSTKETREAVLSAAARVFPTEDLTNIMAALDLYGIESYERERERVQLAILKLSEGNMDKLCHYTGAAKQDYRDVFYWAEYPRSPDEPKSYEELARRLHIDDTKS